MKRSSKTTTTAKASGSRAGKPEATSGKALGASLRGRRRGAAEDKGFHVLKADSCRSLSDKSALTYQLGCMADSVLHLRIHQNSGQGYFSREWVCFADIDSVLKSGGALSARSFRGSFVGRSVNTAGFLLAVLKHLGLVRHQAGSQRLFESAGTEAFLAEMAQLIANAEIASPSGGSEEAALAEEAGPVLEVTTEESQSPMAPARKGTLSLTGRKTGLSPLE